MKWLVGQGAQVARRLATAPTILLLLFITSVASAANHYVRSGATGSASGADWTNACADFTGVCAVGSLVRGDTYYVAGGNYAGRTFSTAVSGTSVITIKGATVADHGTATGWQNSYSVSTTDGGAPANWTGMITFTSSFWTFDGSVGPTWDLTPSHYGFSFGTSLSQAFTIGSPGSVSNNGPALSNIVLSHLYGKATTSDVEREFIEGAGSGGAHSNITISNCLLDGWQGLVTTKGQSGTAYSNWVIQYNVLLNGYSSSANHGEWINPNERPISNWTIAYNVFRGHSGSSGMTGTIVANNSDNNGSKIYGNVFDGLQVGNGVITGTSEGNLNNAVVYNNTFLNMTSDSGDAIGGSGQGSGNVAYNNLFYNTNASHGGGFTFDYNAYFATTNTPAETHGQSGSGNPFVNAAVFNYHLTAGTSAGTTLASPFTIDPEGKTRGADGVWDRGAYEFGSGAPPPPPPPSGSACDVNGDGTTNVVDVQQEVNQALGIVSCTADINKDGQCTVVDVQRVVNAALGGQCVSP
jgi:hypothetical protein